MDFEFLEDICTDPISAKDLNSMDDSEVKKQSLHIKELYSKVLDEINKSVQAKNYDYCAAGVTRLQGVLDWKKTVACGDGKLYAGVQIQDNSFRIFVEPYSDFENHKEIYSFEDKTNSSDIYVKVAQWENKILEELSERFDFFILDGKEKVEPYKYNDFKFMKSDIREKTPISELAKVVDVALELITKNSDYLKELELEFSKA